MSMPRTPSQDSSSPSPGWFTHPVLSVLLALMWLLLQRSLDPANILTAVVLALAVPRLVSGFLGAAARPRGPWCIVRFVVIVLWDIVVSNVAVARIVLNPASRPQPAWVPVQLELRHPLALTLLATIITTTPGTVSCVVDDERGLILVHALDCDDPAAMAAQIKQRYEVPLRQIFEETTA